MSKEFVLDGLCVDWVDCLFLKWRIFQTLKRIITFIRHLDLLKAKILTVVSFPKIHLLM